MRPAHSLKPQDVCILLQRALQPDLTYRDLAAAVGVSLGEAHNAVKRLVVARLLLPGAETANIPAVTEFLQGGVPYAFPGVVGAETRGVPTAFSAPPLSELVPSEHQVVWPSTEGTVRGHALQPLCVAAPRMVKSNPELYRLLTLVDALRIGRARERDLARSYLSAALHEVVASA